ncbi:MAG: SecD/SecF family protein translocase subunit [Candidatus Absconditabacterales bacterium]
MKRNWRWVTVIVAIFVVLFVGKFTKGIDVAGGVEFVYKIDFTKYKEIYTNATEYSTVTQRAKQIIEANIRKRVNGLGVGDAEVKLQKAGSDDYVVVRIGGLDDLDAARDIIGKTVELEFALPNALSGASQVIARKELASNLLRQIVTDPSQIKQLGEQGSNDVYYFEITGANKQNLPPALAAQTERISILGSGQVLGELIEGILQPAQGTTGVDTNGYFIVKMNGSTAGSQLQLSDQELIDKARTKGFAVKDEFMPTKASVTGTQLITDTFYNQAGKSILFDLNQPFADKSAYEVDVYGIPTTGSVTSFENLDRKTDLDSMGLVKYVDKKWASSVELSFLADMKDIKAQTVRTVIVTGGQSFVVKIYNTKDASQALYRLITLSNVNTLQEAQSFVNDLFNNNNYDLEVVFVRDRNTRLPAKDSLNRILNGTYFKFASVTRDQVGRPAVQIDLDETGKEIFCKLTESNIQKQMGIFVGGKLVTSPTIQSKICGGSAIINGDFDVASAKLLADDLNEGALPAKLIQVNESKVSATLGEHAWQGAIWATIASLLAILLLMTWRYDFRRAAIALAALVSFIVTLVALLKLMGYALSLSGMAAIILNIGMGVDAAILIYERLKEEMARGRREEEAIYTAYDRSRPAVFGGQMSTIAIGILLVFLGSDLFQGFGLVMTLNIMILLSVSVPLIKWMLLRTMKK